MNNSQNTKRTFEEQFPSLKNKSIRGVIVNAEEFKEELMYDEIEYSWIKKEEIEQTCLDKQKVKEAIDKILFEKEHYYDIKPLLEDLNKELKKELGL